MFDVRDMLANEGIDNDLRTAFAIYLLSHGRPVHGVLDPTRLDISQEHVRGFTRMTAQTVSLEELIETGEQVVDQMASGMPDAHRELRMSFVKNTHDWSLIDVADAEALPAVRWRAENLCRLNNKQSTDLARRLSAVFDS